MFMPFAGFALSFAPHFISYHNYYYYYYYYYDLFASRNAYKIKKNIPISSADNKEQLRTPSLTNNNSSKNNTEALCCVEICELT